MADIEESATIAASSDRVWVVLSDFGAIASWASNVDHSCLTTARREGVGAVRRVQVGRNALLEEVVEWEPGERLAYSIEGLPSVVRSVVNTWTLVADGDSTTVTLTSRIDAGPRPPQQLVARAIGKGLAKASRQMLDGLTAAMEAQPQAASA